MKSVRSDRFDFGRGEREGRVQFDITPSELGSRCNDSFREQLQLGVEGMDSDYKMFLEYLTGSCDRREQPVEGIGGENDGEEGEGEEDEVDPDYEMVMSNLTPCGKSCALKLHEHSGMLVLLKYEGVDDSDEYWDSPAQRKLSEGRNDGEEMGGAKDLGNLQTESYVEKWRGLRSVPVKGRTSSLLEKVLKRECRNTESYDTEGCRKRRRVDGESNQMAEPNELLNGLTSRQACRVSWNTVEGALTGLRMSVENKEVENQQILRSTGEKEQSNSVPEKELGYEIGRDPPLRKSRNTTERETIEVTTPSRNVDHNRKGENKRILRSIHETETRKSIAKKSRHEPASDFGTLRRSRNDSEDLRNVENSRKVEKRRILRSDCGQEKMQRVAEKKLRCEPRFSPQDSSKSRNVIKREKIEVTDHLRNAERNIKLDGRQHLRSNLDKERPNVLAKKKLRSETISHVSHGAKASSRQRFVVENDRISKSQHNCEMEEFEVDGCYQVFLDAIENVGEHVVFVHGGKRVTYEDDDIDNVSDSEIVMWEHDPYSNHDNNNPFVPAKINASVDGKDSEKEVSKFRREVMSILERPYDDKEYKDLLRYMRERKPVVVHKDMRRPKSVEVDRPGKSYLDHHPDLKRKIAALRQNRPKVLNIMRGFFFWLENVSHGGKVFKPWKDALCLAVEPSSKVGDAASDEDTNTNGREKRRAT